MEHLELVLLFLLVSVVALTALASAIDVPYPILLVIGGSVIGFVPGLPEIELAPEVVLLIFLPPLLFNAAYFASVQDLRRSLRPITLNSVFLVLATMGSVGLALRLAVPELPWAAALAFGAIVAPTDPLAAIAITRRLGVPRRMVTVIEGESLINDGTALVLYRTAVAAAVGGTFDLLDATGAFFLNVAGGVVVGLVVAQLVSWVFRRVEDEVLGITISLAVGYAAYLPAEELGVSGVIAAVTAGLVVGHRGHLLFNAGARLRGAAFWDVLVFLLNALLFVLVGLQLPGILESQERSSLELLALGALAGATVIATRLVWINVAVFVIRAVDRRPELIAQRTTWRLRLVAGWCGLRGSVSLAAALALPVAFPERDLLVFLTLSVIFATLVLQGLSLPWLIRRLGIEDDGEAGREELVARRAATEAALERLRGLRSEPWVRDDTVDRMVGLHDFRLRRLVQRAGEGEAEAEEDLDARSLDYQRLVRAVLDAQRDELVRRRDAGEISDAVMHQVVRELDLEDQRLEI